MKQRLKIVAAFFVLASLATLLAYFLTSPDLRITRSRTLAFRQSASRAVPFAVAIRESPKFYRIQFGNCGHLDASPDSGPQGSLVYVPANGPFARYSSVDDFLRLNPALLGENPECRHVVVVYMTQFPYQGQVKVDLDESGRILAYSDPEFGS